MQRATNIILGFLVLIFLLSIAGVVLAADLPIPLPKRHPHVVAERGPVVIGKHRILASEPGQPAERPAGMP